MSSAEPGAWQQEGIVAEFLRDRQALLPLIDVQEDIVRHLLRRRGRELRAFLDIGAGAGAMSELVLAEHPGAEAVLVDYSEPMLARAERRLDQSRLRWSALRADLRDPAWADALPRGAYDAAVSSYAIHHLPAARKQALFAELHALLAPGGIFVNVDFVAVHGPLAGLFDERMVENAVALEHAHGGDRSPEQVERELLADGDDDQPDTLEDQLRWLADAGFEHPEAHFKWAEAAVFGATKPGGAR